MLWRQFNHMPEPTNEDDRMANRVSNRLQIIKGDPKQVFRVRPQRRTISAASAKRGHNHNRALALHVVTGGKCNVQAPFEPIFLISYAGEEPAKIMSPLFLMNSRSCGVTNTGTPGAYPIRTCFRRPYKHELDLQYEGRHNEMCPFSRRNDDP